MDTSITPHTLVLLGGEQLLKGLQSAVREIFTATPGHICLVGWGFNADKPRAASYRLGLTADALGLSEGQTSIVMPGEPLADAVSGFVFCGGNPVVLTDRLLAHPADYLDRPIVMQAGSAAAVGSHIVTLQTNPPALSPGLEWLPGYAVLPHADHLLPSQISICRQMLVNAGIKGFLIDQEDAVKITDGIVTPLGSGTIRIITPDGGTMRIDASHPIPL